MRVVIIWRDNTDYARGVISWLRDFEKRGERVPESLSPDEPAGESLCKAYDVVEYPTILALDSMGRLQKMWRGKEMPMIDDVMYYLIEQ
jgi:hypothetical protein